MDSIPAKTKFRKKNEDQKAIWWYQIWRQNFWFWEYTLKGNMNKTKVMISWQNCKDVKNTDVCGRDDGTNSIQLQ